MDCSCSCFHERRFGGLSPNPSSGRDTLIGPVCCGNLWSSGRCSVLVSPQRTANSSGVKRNMVEGLPAELPIVDVAARLDGKSSELPENGALLKGAEESQVWNVLAYSGSAKYICFYSNDL